MKTLVLAGSVVGLFAGCALAQTPEERPAASVQRSAKDCGVNLGRYMNMDPATFNDTIGQG